MCMCVINMSGIQMSSGAFVTGLWVKVPVDKCPTNAGNRHMGTGDQSCSKLVISLALILHLMKL